MKTVKLLTYLYKAWFQTNHISLYFQVKAEPAQPQTRMEGFMNTVTERIRRAREERRIAETEKDSFPNPAAKSVSTEPKSSQSSSANLKSSRDKTSSDAYSRKRKRNNAHEELAVN